MGSSILKTDLTKRVYGLDVLRATAIVFVLIYHVLDFLPEVSQEWVLLFVRHGVSIFFALSGYLIGGILIKSLNKPNFSYLGLIRFWCNRWVRTLPPYYFTLVFLIVIMYLCDSTMAPTFLSRGLMAHYFVFLQNFSSPRLSFFPESWSLSIEEWFYLITPLLLFFLYKLIKLDLKKSIISTITLIIISAVAIRSFRDGGSYCDEYQVINRLDSLMYGVLGAYISYYYHQYWVKSKESFFIAGLVVWGLVLINDIFVFPIFEKETYYIFIHNVFYGSAIPIIVFLFLPQMSSIKTGKGFLYKSITYISLISYSLYLVNYTLVKYFFVGEILEGRLAVNLSNGMHIFLICTISLLLATLMYLYLEKPCMDIRKKIKFLKE